MWKMVLLQVCFTVSLLVSVSGHVYERQGVFEVDSDSFKPFLQSKDLVMMEFYAPWCGHCKKLEPEYEKAAERLRGKGILLAKVDGSKEQELAKEYEIQGFPTLLTFRNGELLGRYEGERNSRGIVQHMEQLSDPNWTPPADVVVQLAADNFTSYMKTNDLVLVLFFSPWTKESKEILPDFEDAAKDLKEWAITLAKVNGAREKELTDQFQVKKLPSLMLFRKSKPFPYNGPMNKEGLIDYMKEQNKPASIEKFSHQGISSSLERTEVTVVGFFAKKSDLHNEYDVVANQMRGAFTFMHTFDEEVAKSFNIPMGSVAIFMPEVFWTPYENKTILLSKKSATHTEILQFVHDKSVPLVGMRNKKNLFKYQSRPLIVAYYDVNYDHQFLKDTQYIRDKIVAVAKDFAKSNLKFAISNEVEFQEEVFKLGMEDNGEDVSIACYTDKQKFRMLPDGEFESEQLRQFIKDLRGNKIKPFLRSMPVPKKQDSIVKKIVADNYDEEVHKVGKRDFVLFIFSPTCKHCKAFDATFTKLAKKMTHQHLVFGKMDGVSNDLPFMFTGISSYPSVFFINGNYKFEPMMYQGDFSYRSLKDWITRHQAVYLTEQQLTGKEALDDHEIESFTKESLNLGLDSSPPPKHEEL